MEESRIYVFMPSMDGEYVPVTFTSPEQDMKDTEVLIFLDEQTRHIYIWTGENSSVRKRFISSQIARQMRLEKGMTHRISTEDQGNETEHFKEFLVRLAGQPVTADTLMEVTPAVAAVTAEPEKPKAKPKPAPSKKPDEKKTTPEKTVMAKPVVKAPAPPPKKKEEKEEEEEPSLEYYSVDSKTEVTKARATLLLSGKKSEKILVALHASSASNSGKIALYSIKRKTKTVAIKSEKPIFVIYLKENSVSVFELDDLEIPIPAGNSIYYTCPSKTFLGINIE